MTLISKNKEKLIGVLRFLNTKPGFRRVFYWIHEIRCTPFRPTVFMAGLIDNSFLLGVYDIDSNRTWQRMVTAGFEKIETEILKKLSPFFDVFVDIGGHIGYYTCLIGTTKPDVQIMAFEPNPINFKSLSKNIEINKLKNAQAFNVGLGEKSGTALLFGNDAGGSLETKAFVVEPKEKVSIKIEKLDSYISYVQKDKPLFIKIDVEATEYMAFKGGLKFIETTKPVGILAEIVLNWSGGVNPRFRDTINLLHGLGYQSYSIDEKLPLEKNGAVETMTGGNYLFIRKDMVNIVKSKTNILK